MVAPCGTFWESEHKGMSVLVFSIALPDCLSLKKLGYLKVNYKSKLDRAKGLSGMLYEKKQKPVNLHFHTKPKLGKKGSQRSLNSTSSVTFTRSQVF